MSSTDIRKWVALLESKASPATLVEGADLGTGSVTADSIAQQIVTLAPEFAKETASVDQDYVSPEGAQYFERLYAGWLTKNAAALAKRVYALAQANPEIFGHPDDFHGSDEVFNLVDELAHKSNIIAAVERKFPDDADSLMHTLPPELGMLLYAAYAKAAQ